MTDMPTSKADTMTQPGQALATCGQWRYYLFKKLPGGDAQGEAIPTQAIKSLQTTTTNGCLLCARFHVGVLYVLIISYYYSPCTDKETDAQRGGVPCLGPYRQIIVLCPIQHRLPISYLPAPDHPTPSRGG